jgi:hypothetical protein
MFTNLEEARYNWCPMERIPYGFSDESGASANRDHDGSISDEYRCIACHCMMWRWKDNGKNEEGFCGLAGEPKNY